MYLFPEINLIPKEKTVLDLPEETVKNRMVLLCLAGSLAWDYAFTVLDLAAQMKLSELRKLSRTIRQLKDQYDIVLQHGLNRANIESLTQLGLQYENVCQKSFSKLAESLHKEKEIKVCRADYRYLVVAVQMAMAILDAIKMFAANFDSYLRSQGVNGKTVEIAQLSKLAELLPLFAGDAYNPASPSRKKTAEILFNELKLYEINGINTNTTDSLRCCDRDSRY